jgi:hypothetical protein
LRFCQRYAKPVRTEPYKTASTRMTTSASSLLSSADMTYANDRGPIQMSLTRLKTARSAVRSRPCPPR